MSGKSVGERQCWSCCRRGDGSEAAQSQGCRRGSCAGCADGWRRMAMRAVAPARGRPAANRWRQRRVSGSRAGHRPLRPFNDTHLCEVLASEHHIELGRGPSDVCSDSGQEGQTPAQAAALSTPPYTAARQGELLLWDGSKHRWLGEQQPFSVLMAALDDATGTVVDAFFCPAETSWPTFTCSPPSCATAGRSPSTTTDTQVSCAAMVTGVSKSSLPIAGAHPGRHRSRGSRHPADPLLAPQGRGASNDSPPLQDRLLAELARTAVPLRGGQHLSPRQLHRSLQPRFGRPPATQAPTSTLGSSTLTNPVAALHTHRRCRQHVTLGSSSSRSLLDQATQLRQILRRRPPASRWQLDCLCPRRPLASHPPSQLLDPNGSDSTTEGQGTPAALTKSCSSISLRHRGSHYPLTHRHNSGHFRWAVTTLLLGCDTGSSRHPDDEAAQASAGEAHQEEDADWPQPSRSFCERRRWLGRGRWRWKDRLTHARCRVLRGAVSGCGFAHHIELPCECVLGR